MIKYIMVSSVFNKLSNQQVYYELGYVKKCCKGIAL